MANDPLKPGKETSENGKATLAIILGFVAMLVPELVDIVLATMDAFPSTAAVGSTIVQVAGLITTVLAALGYGAQRAGLKKAALAKQ